MKKETMTPKERWEAVLKRQKPDRLPMDYWATEEDTEKILKYLGLTQEVMDNIRILGKDGGYIIIPCHNIQSVNPPENIITLYQTIYEYDWL